MHLYFYLLPRFPVHGVGSGRLPATAVKLEAKMQWSSVTAVGHRMRPLPANVAARGRNVGRVRRRPRLQRLQRLPPSDPPEPRPPHRRSVARGCAARETRCLRPTPPAATCQRRRPWPLLAASAASAAARSAWAAPAPSRIRGQIGPDLVF